MTAFFVARVSVKDGKKFQDYAQKAMATITKHGGELVIRGAIEGALAGAADHHSIAVVKFPNIKTLNKWYASPEYQSVVPLRNEASDMSITTYSVPA